ncbi:hypothetical protein OIV83_006434 [Microbotryomycetes sp. JL201]|nr:hypothetical protein OIV83_006434 [Microbotryomycetes sp. JL201]
MVDPTRSRAATSQKCEATALARVDKTPHNMSTSQTLRTSFSRLAQAWPKDALRPTMQFSAAIANASDRIFAPHAATTTDAADTRSSSSASPSTPNPSGSGPTRELTESQRLKAQATIDSLERLLANDALKRYPMGPKTIHPPSFPKHYDRIREGAERAARGEIVKAQRWKQFFQWK